MPESSSRQANLHYSDQHEWIDAVTGIAKVGITDFAAEALGDIVFIQLPEEGTMVAMGEPCGEIESTKSVSELYAPATGSVVTVNGAVLAEPGLLNTDPYGAGWLYTLQITDTPTLMTAEEYVNFLGGTR